VGKGPKKRTRKGGKVDGEKKDVQEKLDGTGMRPEREMGTEMAGLMAI